MKITLKFNCDLPTVGVIIDNNPGQSRHQLKSKTTFKIFWNILHLMTFQGQ